jgi:hypothetical protein
MSTAIQEILACSECGQTTQDGLVLMPSGRTFKRHAGEDGVKHNGKPQTAEPEAVKVEPVKAGTKTECVECDEVHPALRTPDRVRKHLNPDTLKECEQRLDVQVNCPVCSTKRTLKKRLLVVHKDITTGTRCPASAKTVAEAQTLRKKAAPAKATAAPKETGKKTDAYAVLSPLNKSRFKAIRLGNELKELPESWRFKIENGPDPDQATLVTRRGTGNDMEEMRISWWNGACLGGEGRITHTYRGRTLAIRNANAIRQRAQMPAEQVAAEFAKVATRRTTTPRKRKTPDQLREVMPFDPNTATDEEILRAVLNRTVRWERKIDGKMDDDVVKGKPVIKTTPKGRQLSFRGQNTTRTVQVEQLVSVS